MEATSVYEAWSELFRYPVDGGRERVRSSIEEIAEAAPELEGGLRSMREFAASHPETELEEVFTRTFDSNAERALELGWHLHGENYARGAFMVRMRQALREFGIEERAELPDHLSHVLPLLGRAGDDLATELARDVVLPALRKIAAGFGEGDNPYQGVVTSLTQYVDGRHHDDQGGDAKSCGNAKQCANATEGSCND